MRRTMALGYAACAALLALTLAGCSPPAVKPSAPVNLSGRWVLNEARSDDVRKVVAAERKERRPQRQLDPNDPLADLDLPEDADSRSSWQRDRDFRDRYESDLHALLWLDARQLDIRQSDRELVIENEDASTRYVYGQKTIVSIPRGVADRLAGWKGRAFVVETRAPHGPAAEQRYELSPDGRQLIATTELGGAGPRVTVRRVFDREAF